MRVTRGTLESLTQDQGVPFSPRPVFNHLQHLSISSQYTLCHPLTPYCKLADGDWFVALLGDEGKGRAFACLVRAFKDLQTGE